MLLEEARSGIFGGACLAKPMPSMNFNFMIIPVTTFVEEAVRFGTVLEGTYIRLQILQNMSPVWLFRTYASGEGLMGLKTYIHE